MGYKAWGGRESDTTEATQHSMVKYPRGAKRFVNILEYFSHRTSVMGYCCLHTAAGQRQRDLGVLPHIPQ